MGIHFLLGLRAPGGRDNIPGPTTSFYLLPLHWSWEVGKGMRLGSSTLSQPLAPCTGAPWLSPGTGKQGVLWVWLWWARYFLSAGLSPSLWPSMVGAGWAAFCLLFYCLVCALRNQDDKLPCGLHGRETAPGAAPLLQDAPRPLRSVILGLFFL